MHLFFCIPSLFLCLLQKFQVANGFGPCRCFAHCRTRLLQPQEGWVLRLPSGPSDDEDAPSYTDESSDLANTQNFQSAPIDLLSRFTDPRLDDPFLPLTDVLMAQIVAPSLQVFWLSLVRAPSPTWLKAIFTNALWQSRGSLVAPTLIHGAGLACCWLLGALAAKAYERKAIDPTVEGYGTVVWTILKAGAFATGVLVLCTQIDLLLEFRRYVQPGESEETDLRLLSALVEVLNDVIFEASTLTTMRLYLAYSTASNK